MVNNRWWALFVLFITRAILGFQFQSVASTAPSLIQAFHIDYVAVGTLVGLFTLPGLVCSLPAGMIGKKIGNRATITLGLLLMTVGGVATGMADNLMLASAGRLLSGIGAIALFVLLTKMTSDWFIGKEIGLAMAFIINAWPIGIGFGIWAHSQIEGAFSWRAVFFASAILSFVAMALMQLTYRNPKVDAAGAVAATRISTREVLAVSGSALGLTLYNAAIIIIVTFVPAMFVASGLSKSAAGSIVNMHIAVSIIGVGLGGYVATRKYKLPSLFIFSLGAAALLVGCATGSLPAAAFIFLGLVIGVPAAYLMTLPLAYLQAGNRDVGFGIFYTWVYGGLALLMMVAGYVREAAASPAAPLFFAALLLCLVPFVTVAFLGVQSGKFGGSRRAPAL
jgi:predicted MFS family arabinose efflux permease